MEANSASSVRRSIRTGSRLLAAVLVIGLVLSSCSYLPKPGGNADVAALVATSVAATVAAMPTQAPLPTYTPYPSPTPAPTAAPTDTPAATAVPAATPVPPPTPAPTAMPGVWCTRQGSVNICVGNFEYLEQVSFHTAAPGQKFLGVTVAVSNAGADNAYVSPVAFTLVDTADVAHSLESVTFSYKQPLESGTLLPGTQVGGSLIFALPADSAPRRIAYAFPTGTLLIDLQRNPDRPNW
jgi:hypothetical protein